LDLSFTLPIIILQVIILLKILLFCSDFLHFINLQLFKITVIFTSKKGQYSVIIHKSLIFLAKINSNFTPHKDKFKALIKALIVSLSKNNHRFFGGYIDHKRFICSINFNQKIIHGLIKICPKTSLIHSRYYHNQTR